MKRKKNRRFQFEENENDYGSLKQVQSIKKKETMGCVDVERIREKARMILNEAPARFWPTRKMAECK